MLPPGSFAGAPLGVPGLDLVPPMLQPLGLPPIPGYSSGGGGGGGKSKGRGSKGSAAAVAAAAAAAAAALEDEDEGLMQLLNAAEELHRWAFLLLFGL